MAPEFIAQKKQTEVQPQAKLYKKGLHHGSMKIGIPKEVTLQENRVPLTPSSVGYLTGLGCEIILQAGCGENANFKTTSIARMAAKSCIVLKRFTKPIPY